MKRILLPSSLTVALVAGLLPLATASRPPSLRRLSHSRMWPAVVRLADDRVLVTGGPSNVEGPAGRDPRGSTCELWTADGTRPGRAGRLRHGRMGHTATLLADGRVLVAGGVEHSGTVGSAEVWDPTTNRWSLTRPMREPRTDHTAVRLADGRVLVVGGIMTSNMRRGELWTSIPAAPAEVWDPATGEWTLLGVPGEAREDPTATLLADGRVLVVGGGDGVGHGLASASIFDPRTGSFAPTGEMSVGRNGHAATLLADGRVMVSGGSHDIDLATRRFFGTAEIWDPGTGRWSRTEIMREPRRDHTMSLLPDGRVMVAGGGNVERSAFEASVELWDPGTGRWTLGRPLAQARAEHAALVLGDGRVVIVGGEDDEGAARGTIETVRF